MGDWAKHQHDNSDSETKVDRELLCPPLFQNQRLDLSADTAVDCTEGRFYTRYCSGLSLSLWQKHTRVGLWCSPCRSMTSSVKRVQRLHVLCSGVFCSCLNIKTLLEFSFQPEQSSTVGPSPSGRDRVQLRGGRPRTGGGSDSVLRAFCASREGSTRHFLRHSLGAGPHPPIAHVLTKLWTCYFLNRKLILFH